MSKLIRPPKILLLDIETKPLKGYFWSLFEEQGGLPMLTEDWSIIAWSAQWYDVDGKKKYPLIYRDLRKSKDIMNDKVILKELRELLNEADYVVGHNVAKFDIKKINARLVHHDIPKPKPYQQIDTLKIAKKHFNLTSFKLEYLGKYLKCTVQKLTDRKFQGISLWDQCIQGNKEAWNEMERYNKRDVVLLEQVFRKLIPWDNTINLSVFMAGEFKCLCGSTEYKEDGHYYGKNSIHKRYECKGCKKPFKHPTNLLSEKEGGPGTKVLKVV